MSFLFLTILLVRVLMEKLGILKRREERSDEERVKIALSQFKYRNGFINAILSKLESFEKFLLRKGRVLFGSSIIIIARKG